MDKELLAGLNNLSEAILTMAEILQKKDAKSATGNALKAGDFSKQLRQISIGIKDIKRDTQKILNQQDTILKMLKKEDKKEKPVEKVSKGQTNVETAKEVKKEDKKEKPVEKVSKGQTNVETAKEVKKEDKKEKSEKVSKGQTNVETAKESKKEDKKEKTSEKVSKGQTNVETAKEVKKEDKKTSDEKSKSFLGGIDTKKVKDGVSTIMMIAVGVVAIGLALKIVGKIDFLSVLGIALALPLIAISFSKISSIFTGGEVTDEKGRKIRTAKLDRKDIPNIIFSIVAFSTAITLSSYILSKVKPIGLLQGISAIMIAGVFALMGPSLGKMINAFSRINMITALKASLFLPVVLVAVSAAIMGSSYFIANVKPIGLLQAFSSIMIAGVFAVISMGLGKLISAFGRINPVSAFLAARMLPVVLLAVSVSIMLASFVLSAVKPVGLLQAITSIVIAGVFTVISFGIGKIISAFRKVDPVTAIAAATLMPILFVALSASIMMSSYLLSQVKPIGLLQAITSIAISAVFVVLSFGITKMMPAFRRIKPAEAVTAALMMPIVFTALSLSILLSSNFLYQVRPIGILQFLTSLAISALFVGFAFTAGLIVKWTKNLKTKDVLFGSFVVLTMTTTVALAGFIISKSTLPGAAQIFKFVGFSIALGVTTIAIAGTLWALKKLNIGLTDIVKGGIAILAIATTIMLTSLIVSLGTYDKYPSLKWILGVGASVVGFGLVADVLGTIAISGVGALAILAGLASILAIAGTIVLVDKIISMGTFSKFPGLKWITGVGASMIGFGLAAVTLGGLIVGTLGLGAIAIAAGLAATLKIAENIVDTDKIISTGKYDKFPPKEWVSSVGDALLKFSTAVVTLGAIDSVGGIASTLSFGLVKNPIDSGIESTLKIAQSIVDVDRILAKGRYTGGPTSKWSSGISMALGAFWPIYKILLENSGWFSSGVSPDDFSKAIRTISQGIVDSASYFRGAKTSFENGPPVAWADGVSRALGAFTPIYEILVKNSGWWKSGVSVDDFKNAINTITSGIISSALRFSGTRGLFNKENAPSVEWSDGVGRAITAFAPVFEYLNNNSGWFGSDVEDLNEAIIGIANSIVETSKILKDGVYSSDIKKEYFESVSLGIEKFVGLYKITEDVDVDDLGKIWTIASHIKGISIELSYGNYSNTISDKFIQGVEKGFNIVFNLINRFKRVNITDTAKIFLVAKTITTLSNSFERAKFQKYPSERWIKGIENTFNKFRNVILTVNKSSLSTYKDGILKAKIITEFILWIDKKIPIGKYNKWPEKNWLMKTENVIKQYGQLSIDSDKKFGWPKLLSGIEKIKMISRSILWIDQTLSKGNYRKWPEKKWIDKTSTSILRIGEIAILVDKKFGLVSLNLGLWKSRSIARTISEISSILEKGSYNKYPSLEWSKSVPKSIAGFMDIPFKGVFGNLFETIFGSSEDDKKSQLGKIVDLMLYVDGRFKSGDFAKFPTVAWVEGTVLSLQKFSNIVSLLSFSSIGDSIMSQFGFGNPIVSAVSNIEKLAVSFDKLSRSLKSFSDSIKEIDNDKLSTINSLSSNVILLSLMDPEQFDKMMSKLEERSGVFAQLVKEFEGKKKQLEQGGITTGVTQPVKEQPKNLELQKISQKMDTMNALLADISSVVGSRGTLKAYLVKIKDDVNIGGNTTNLTARSDMRLKNIVKKLGVSNLGINIYAFTYKFDPNTVYQGVIAQELIGKFDSALLVDKNGIYSVDYSKIDVEFKKTNIKN